jgi:hypothetical protein
MCKRRAAQSAGANLRYFRPDRLQVPRGLIVVLVAMTPAMPVSFTISIISSNWLVVRSGAIFKKIGLGLMRSLFFVCSSVQDFRQGSFLLQISQTGRIRRAYIHYKIIDHIRKVRRETNQVIAQ